jgi:1-acyl-sn-glycerol-3-phosphate acyltransferase
VRLRPGIAHLARRAEATILPLAIELPFWNERKPEALVRFGPPVEAEIAPLPPKRGERLGKGDRVAAWTAVLEQALTACMDALAAAAMSRDPARFVTLVRGEVGVGGIYDLWRRGVAWGAGRRFDPSHGGEA